MSKIFVVVASGGKYEDAWRRPVLASHDKDKVQFYVDAKVRERAVITDIKTRHRDAIRAWVNANPEPAILDYTLPDKPWPLWTGLKEKEITQEMRNTREVLRKKHHEDCKKIVDEAHAENAAWWAKQKVFSTQWLTEHNYSEKDIEFSYDTPDGWSIKEVDFV